MEIRIVKSKRQLKEFIMLPWKLHKGHNNWVPPLIKEQFRYFDRRLNPAFSYCNTVLALAVQNGQTVGRIMGIENTRFNALKGKKDGRFALLDCIDDAGVASGLLQFTEDWAREKGLERIIGPMGMCFQDPKGFQVEGFDELPAVSTYCNEAYVVELMHQANYQMYDEMVVYKIDIKENIPEFYTRIYQRIAANPSLKLIPINNSRQLKELAFPILDLLNDSFADLDDFVPLDRKEMEVISQQFISILDPRFVKAATFDGQLAGFMIAMPNITKGFMAANGRLFPFGLLKILKARKHADRLDLLIGGIHPKYRGRGIDVLIGKDMMESARLAGLTTIDTHLELVSNKRVRAEMEKVGGQIYKRYQLFFKSLT